MDSPYKRNKYRKKNKKPNSTIAQSRTHRTNDTPKNKKNSKSNKKNDLKSGSVENNQEDNTKFITLARKMIDGN